MGKNEISENNSFTECQVPFRVGQWVVPKAVSKLDVRIKTVKSIRVYVDALEPSGKPTYVVAYPEGYASEQLVASELQTIEEAKADLTASFIATLELLERARIDNLDLIESALCPQEE